MHLLLVYRQSSADANCIFSALLLIRDERHIIHLMGSRPRLAAAAVKVNSLVLISIPGPLHLCRSTRNGCADDRMEARMRTKLGTVSGRGQEYSLPDASGALITV